MEGLPVHLCLANLHKSSLLILAAQESVAGSKFEHPKTKAAVFPDLLDAAEMFGSEHNPVQQLSPFSLTSWIILYPSPKVVVRQCSIKRGVSRLMKLFASS